VHCVVPLSVAKARYRATAGQRHAGHLDAARDDHELWGQPARALGAGPVVAVGTAGPVDIAHVAARLAQVLTGAASPGAGPAGGRRE
jgi:hypothetical protein